MARIDPAAYCIGREAVWLADQRDRAADDTRSDARHVRNRGQGRAARTRPGAGRAYPGRELHLIAGSGHISNLERADEFNRLVEEFIKQAD